MTDLSKLLTRLTAVMNEYVALAEQYMELHRRLKAGVADRPACIAEMDRLKQKMAALFDQIEGGRKLLGSGGDPEGSA